MIYLYLEDIIANALIEKNKLDGTTQVSWNLLEQYGEEILKKLTEKGYLAKIKLSSQALLYFEKNFSNYFTWNISNEELTYYLNENRTIEEINLKFRQNLPKEMIEILHSIDIKSIITIPKEYSMESSEFFQKIPSKYVLARTKK